MLKTIAMISLGVAVAIAPVAASAQAYQAGAAHAKAARHTRTPNRSPQHSRDTSKQRARASAEHLRNMGNPQ
jgi:hypothetical protein